MKLVRLCSRNVRLQSCTNPLFMRSNRQEFQCKTQVFCVSSSNIGSTTSKDNWFTRKYKEYSSQPSKRALTAAGTLLSTNCLQGVTVDDFIEYFDMPDTFNSWFLIAELHLYMVSNRLMVNQSEEGKQISHAMQVSLWKDVSERVKVLAYIPAKKRQNYVIGLSKEFQVSFTLNE